MKLKSYGIEGHLLEWVTAFLTNRKQRVQVLSYCQSCWSDITSGIPRDHAVLLDTLGPILFFLYINDLATRLSSYIIKS